MSGFYKLGGGFEDDLNGGLGIYRLGEYARALGYGARSGIQLPGEARGLIPDPRWKRINQGENWSTGDTYIATVGQGYVLSTPLQVLLSGATLANNGILMQPTVVRQITDADGNAQTVWFSPSDFTLWKPVPGSGEAEREGETWINLADGSSASALPEGSYQISPFVPNAKWDITTDPRIGEYVCEAGNCLPTGETKVVDPSGGMCVQRDLRDETGGTLIASSTVYSSDRGQARPEPPSTDDVALGAQRCQRLVPTLLTFLCAV
jgi:hypothetical protein